MKKRKLKKKAIYILATSFSIIILLVCVFLFKDKFFFKENPFTLDKNESKDITMLVAGNVLLDYEIIKDATVQMDVFDFNYIFKESEALTEPFDLKYYNQSSIIGGVSLGYNDRNKYNSPDNIGDTMNKLGFNLVSLSNKNSFDKGEEAIEYSINYWKTKNVLYSGLNLSEDDSNMIQTKEIKGIRYTLISYTIDTNYSIPKEKEHLVNIYSEEKAKKDIEKAKKESELIIVSIDWKDTSNSDITENQLKIVNYLSDLGANIIIGNSNFVQPITLIKDTLVLYSSGNLLSNNKSNDQRTSLITKFNINKDKDNKIVFTNIQSSLYYSYNQSNANYSVIPYSSIDSTLFKDYIEYYNKYFDIITSENKEIIVDKVGD